MRALANCPECPVHRGKLVQLRGVLGDVNLGRANPIQSLEKTVWMPDLPVILPAYWHHQNLCGKPHCRRIGTQAGLRAAETSST